MIFAIQIQCGVVVVGLLGLGFMCNGRRVHCVHWHWFYDIDTQTNNWCDRLNEQCDRLNGLMTVWAVCTNTTTVCSFNTTVMSVKFGAITRRSKFCCIHYLRYGSALVRGVLCLLSPCVPCTGVMWRVGVDRLSGQANCQEHYVGIGGLGCFRGFGYFLDVCGFGFIQWGRGFVQ